MKNQELTNRIDDLSAEIGCLYDTKSQIDREIKNLEKVKQILINQEVCTHNYENGESAVEDKECYICEKDFN